MSDLIDRQAVLNLAKDIIVPTKDGEYRHRSIDPQAVRELPSASQWIPCAERLPQEMEDVLVDDGTDMFVAWRYKGEWGSSDNNLDEYTPILAWMPITPYKESE